MAESFVLNTGARIPSVGLGVWQIQPDAVGNAIYAAVKVQFDCSEPLLISLSYRKVFRPVWFLLLFENFLATVCVDPENYRFTASGY
jgi:hypothetical protein